MPSTNIKFGDITDQLIEKGAITEVDAGKPLDGKKKLAHFQTDPKDSTETENNIFKRLNKDILENLVVEVVQKYSEVRSTTPLTTEFNTTTAVSSEEEPDEKMRLATRDFPRSLSKVAGRKHYCNIVKQVASPIWQLTRLSDVFLVLSDSAKILEALAKNEWVHRDTSAGNVYHCNRKGLMGDLEYAKIKGPGGGHEVLTGTQDFMVAEVLCQYYYALRVCWPLPQIGGNEVPKLETLDVNSLDSLNFVIPEVIFEHNPGHDIESLFWLAVFMLFFYRDVESPKQADQDQEERRQGMDFVFPDKILVSEYNRKAIIFLRQDFKNRVQWVSESFKPLINPLYFLNVTLCQVYTAFEDSLLEEKDEKIFLKAHDTAIAIFDMCMRQSSNITIESLKSSAERTQLDRQSQPEHQSDNQ